MIPAFKEFIQKFMTSKKDKLLASSEALSRDMSPKNQIIAVCNQKGGCGKTTTSINLAASLASKGYKVLLMDLDPQAHATLGLGVDPDSLERTIYDVLTYKVNFEAILIRLPFENLELAPASSILSGAALELSHMLGRETVLKTALKKLELTRTYDFIIMDCSPSLNLVTLNALAAANFVLVPIQPHYYSLEGMRELFSTLEIVKERINNDLDVIGILITLFDARIKMNHQMVEQIKDYFVNKVFDGLIHNTAKLCESPIHKKPIHVFAPKSQGAKDYHAVADEILLRLGVSSYTEKISKRGNIKTIKMMTNVV